MKRPQWLSLLFLKLLILFKCRCLFVCSHVHTQAIYTCMCLFKSFKIFFSVYFILHVTFRMMCVTICVCGLGLSSFLSFLFSETISI